MSERLPRNAELESLTWFHPEVSRHTAESMLMHNGVEGTYLIRPSSKSNQFSLSVRSKDSVKHYEVKWNGNSYSLGLATFDTFDDFVQHFNNRPIIGESDQVVMLEFPYPRDVSEPPLYGSVSVHAEMGRNASVHNKPSLTLSTKEGYLTKLGGVIKNWKKRWFVVSHNTMKYYKTKESVEPIRVLDLAECKSCAESDIREFCFSVEMPWRTFYFCAGNCKDRDEWIALIAWKLKEGARERANHS